MNRNEKESKKTQRNRVPPLLVPKHPDPPEPMMICVIANPPLLLMIPLAGCPEVGFG